jgi:hypothetical protein
MDNHPTSHVEAVEAIMSIAKAKNISFSKAAATEEGRYIMWLAGQLPQEPEPIAKYDGDATTAPDYLKRAAEEIARRDGISTEVAFAKVRRERPELAARYAAEAT